MTPTEEKIAKIVTKQILKNVTNEEAKQEIREWARVNKIDISYSIMDV